MMVPRPEQNIYENDCAMQWILRMNMILGDLSLRLVSQGYTILQQLPGKSYCVSTLHPGLPCWNPIWDTHTTHGKTYIEQNKSYICRCIFIPLMIYQMSTTWEWQRHFPRTRCWKWRISWWIQVYVIYLCACIYIYINIYIYILYIYSGHYHIVQALVILYEAPLLLTTIPGPL